MGIISGLYDSIVHHIKYLTDSKYKEREDERNSEEWKEGHKGTLEGLERELGIDKKIVDVL